MPENENTQPAKPKRTGRSSQRKRPDSTQPSAKKQEGARRKAQRPSRTPTAKEQISAPKEPTPSTKTTLVETGPKRAKWFPTCLVVILIIIIIGLLGLTIFLLVRDTTPPLIQNVSFSGMSEKSTTITWQTNKPATSEVRTCSPEACTLPEPDKSLVTQHSATLSDLKPDAAYHFTLISRDKSGNEATLEIELTTPPPPYVPPPISAVEVSPGIGKPTPDFTLPTLDGKQLSLSQFRGKKVMVNFWQSSCSACRTEVPYIQAVYNRWSRDDLEILAVSVGERTPFVQSFVDRQGLTFPVLLDSDEAVSKTYQVPSYPTTFFINADGIIKKMKDGRFSGESEIEDILNSL